MLALANHASAPMALKGPIFESQYKFVIKYKKGSVRIKNFVAEWALKIVCKMLDSDENVKKYAYSHTFKGAKARSIADYETNHLRGT